VKDEVRKAIDLHLRQGKYPKPNTLSEYLMSKGVPCSPQEALAHMQEYKQKNMIQGNPELVDFLKAKKTSPSDLVERETKQIGMPFDPTPFKDMPQIKHNIPERVQLAPKDMKLPPIGDSLPPETPPETPNELPSNSWKFNVRKALDFMLDGGALIIALVVDIVMNVIGWGIIAYDAWTRVAFISMGMVIVLFAIRAWIKGGVIGKTLWLGFALIATFLDISVSVASSHQQSLVTVYEASKDEVLNKLKADAQKDADYVEALRSAQIQKGQGYATQINNAVSQANLSSQSVRDYHPTIVADQRDGLSSSAIFTAIPDAILSKQADRIIGLTLYSLSFIMLQLVIVTSATTSMGRLTRKEETS